MITRSPVVKRESRSSNSPFIVDVRGDEDQQEMAEDGNESPPEPDTESDTEPHPSLKSSIVKVDEDEDDIDPFAASYLAAQRRAEAEKREAARQAAEKIRVEEDLARFHRERVRNPVPLVEESQITTKVCFVSSSLLAYYPEFPGFYHSLPNPSSKVAIISVPNWKISPNSLQPTCRPGLSFLAIVSLPPSIGSCEIIKERE